MTDAADPAVLARLSGVDAIGTAVAGGDAASVFRRPRVPRALVCSPGTRDSGGVRPLRPTLRALLRLDEHVYRTLDDIALEHQPLLEAIEAGDADCAAALVEAHCDHAGELIAAYVVGRRPPMLSRLLTISAACP